MWMKRCPLTKILSYTIRNNCLEKVHINITCRYSGASGIHDVAMYIHQYNKYTNRTDMPKSHMETYDMFKLHCILSFESDLTLNGILKTTYRLY